MKEKGLVSKETSFNCALNCKNELQGQPLTNFKRKMSTFKDVHRTVLCVASNTLLTKLYSAK